MYAIDFLAKSQPIRKIEKLRYAVNSNMRYFIAKKKQLIGRKTLVVFAACLLLITTFYGSGCAAPTDETPKQFPQSVNTIPESANTSVAPLSDFMQRRTVKYEDGRTVNLIVIKLEKDKFIWETAEDQGAPKTVMAWRQELGADLVINGSYFDEEMRPTGFYKPRDADESRIAWPDRDNQKNGSGYTGLVQIRNGLLSLHYLPASFQKTPTKDSAAFLSYPTLIADGKILVDSDTKKYARRTILAQDKKGIPYIVITESGIISLFEIANWLTVQPEEFSIAVNLDGGGSTGLSYADKKINIEITSAPVPNVIHLKTAAGY